MLEVCADMDRAAASHRRVVSIFMLNLLRFEHAQSGQQSARMVARVHAFFDESGALGGYNTGMQGIVKMVNNFI